MGLSKAVTAWVAALEIVLKLIALPSDSIFSMMAKACRNALIRITSTLAETVSIKTAPRLYCFRLT